MLMGHVFFTLTEKSFESLKNCLRLRHVSQWVSGQVWLAVKTPCRHQGVGSRKGSPLPTPLSKWGHRPDRQLSMPMGPRLLLRPALGLRNQRGPSKCGRGEAFQREPPNQLLPMTELAPGAPWSFTLLEVAGHQHTLVMSELEKRGHRAVTQLPGPAGFGQALCPPPRLANPRWV